MARRESIVQQRLAELSQSIERNRSAAFATERANVLASERALINLEIQNLSNNIATLESDVKTKKDALEKASGKRYNLPDEAKTQGFEEYTTTSFQPSLEGLVNKINSMKENESRLKEESRQINTLLMGPIAQMQAWQKGMGVDPSLYGDVDIIDPQDISLEAFKETYGDQYSQFDESLQPFIEGAQEKIFLEQGLNRLEAQRQSAELNKNLIVSKNELIRARADQAGINRELLMEDLRETNQNAGLLIDINLPANFLSDFGLLENNFAAQYGAYLKDPDNKELKEASDQAEQEVERARYNLGNVLTGKTGSYEAEKERLLKLENDNPELYLIEKRLFDDVVNIGESFKDNIDSGTLGYGKGQGDTTSIPYIKNLIFLWDEYLSDPEANVNWKGLEQLTGIRQEDWEETIGLLKHTNTTYNVTARKIAALGMDPNAEQSEIQEGTPEDLNVNPLDPFDDDFGFPSYDPVGTPQEFSPEVQAILDEMTGEPDPNVGLFRRDGSTANLFENIINLNDIDTTAFLDTDVTDSIENINTEAEYMELTAPKQYREWQDLLLQAEDIREQKDSLQTELTRMQSMGSKAYMAEYESDFRSRMAIKNKDPLISGFPYEMADGGVELFKSFQDQSFEMTEGIEGFENQLGELGFTDEGGDLLDMISSGVSRFMGTDSLSKLNAEIVLREKMNKTLGDFSRSYADNSVEHISNLEAQLGVSRDTPLFKINTQELAEAVAQAEGYYNTEEQNLSQGNSPLNPSQRNNNPGNLKFAGQANAIGADENGFAIFETEEDGWAALVKQLKLNQLRSKNYWADNDPERRKLKALSNPDLIAQFNELFPN